MKINKLKIDIVSDVVCPWCVIGYKNLQKAQKTLKKTIKLDLYWKPFELHPEIPKEGVYREGYFKNKFNQLGNMRSTSEHISQLGNNLGFNFNFKKNEILPNTFLAHRLIWYAGQKKNQNEMSEKLFEAYFTYGENIGLKENLIRLSVSIGMNYREIKNFLDSNKGVEEVLYQENLIRERNIFGVPTYIINDKYLLQGGQEAETIVSFLQRIVEKDLN